MQALFHRWALGTLCSALLLLSPIQDAHAQSLAEVAQATAELEAFTNAISLTGLEQVLGSQDDFMVFAPNNDAMEALDMKYYEPEWKAHLTEIILQHVVAGPAFMLEFWSVGLALDPLSGGPLSVTSVDPYVLNGLSEVVTPDLTADNGVIHIMNATILPPSAQDTIMDIISFIPEFFSTLADLFILAELEYVLQGPGPYTLFAPSNDAFSSLPPGQLDSLKEDPNALLQTLMYHILPGIYLLEDLQAGGSVKTLQGSNMTVDSSIAQFTDLLAANGVLHVIDRVLLPPVGAPDGTRPPLPAPTSAPTYFGEVADEFGMMINGTFVDGTLMLNGTLVDATFVNGTYGTFENGTFVPFAFVNGTYGTFENGTFVPFEFEPLEDPCYWSPFSGANATNATNATDDETDGEWICPEPTVDTTNVTNVTEVPDSLSIAEYVNATNFTGGSIVDILEATNFTILLYALEQTIWLEELQGEEPRHTIFAPPNDGWDALPAKFLDDPVLWNSHLSNVVSFHMLEGDYLSDNLTLGVSLSTLNFNNITVTSEDPFQINEVTVTEIDNIADNGVIQVIERVLLPPSATDTALDLFKGFPEFSIFLELLDVANLTDTLTEEGPFTVAAPMNTAFEALPDGLTLDGLRNDPALAREILLYHIAPDLIEFLTVPNDVTNVTTLLGPKVTYSRGLTPEDSNSIGDGTVMFADLLVSRFSGSKSVFPCSVLTLTYFFWYCGIIPKVQNGLVQVIDRILIPPDETESPTFGPTVQPSENFTAVPSENATAAPSAAGTDMLTFGPTIAATSTNAPSAAPNQTTTFVPTAIVTESVTSVPTVAGSTTNVPTGGQTTFAPTPVSTESATFGPTVGGSTNAPTAIGTESASTNMPTSGQTTFAPTPISTQSATFGPTVGGSTTAPTAIGTESASTNVPTGGQTTFAPTPISTESATFGPTVGGSTNAPTAIGTESASTVPTVAGSTNVPSGGQTTFAPTASGSTSIPTAGGSTNVPTGGQTTFAPTPISTESATFGPTVAGSTDSPTGGQTTFVPTASGSTSVPTAGGSTNVPTGGQTTFAPTPISTESATFGPTVAGSTNTPTGGQTTFAPTAVGSTSIPTAGGSTNAPTGGQTTFAPTAAGSTSIPTAGGSTNAPTGGQTTFVPTAGGSTNAPTARQTTTSAPSTAVTEVTTSAPTEGGSTTTSAPSALATATTAPSALATTAPSAAVTEVGTSAPTEAGTGTSAPREITSAPTSAVTGIVTSAPTESGSTLAVTTAPTESGSTLEVTTAPTESGSTTAITTAPTEAGSTTAVTSAPTELGSTTAVTSAPTESGSTTAVTSAPTESGAVTSSPTESGSTTSVTSAPTAPGSTNAPREITSAPSAVVTSIVTSAPTEADQTDPPTFPPSIAPTLVSGPPVANATDAPDSTGVAGPPVAAPIAGPVVTVAPADEDCKPVPGTSVCCPPGAVDGIYFFCRFLLGNSIV